MKKRTGSRLGWREGQSDRGRPGGPGWKARVWDLGFQVMQIQSEECQDVFMFKKILLAVA